MCYYTNGENVCLRFPDRRTNFMNQELELVMNTLIGEMGKMEARINGRMDERFEAIETRLDRHDKRFEAIEKCLDQHDKRFDKMDQRMDCMERDMKMYVNMLVDEIGRMETKMDKRFNEMDVRLDSMQHEINGCKLACDTVSILIQKVDQHEIRIEKLEKKASIGKMLPVGN